MNQCFTYSISPSFPFFAEIHTFSAKEKDSETGLSYFGSRYYSSDLSIWLSVDPMSDKYPSLSPYVYCANNPVKLVDPNGEEVDWVERTVNGKKEVYYDRSVKSQADVDNKYGKNSGVRHLEDGSTVGNGQYTVYNDPINNKNGVMKDANGNIVNPNRTIIYGDNYTLFAGVTDESVNAETLHKNLMGTSYTGSTNPKDYNSKDNFDYYPNNLSEIFSIVHDLQYGDMNAAGKEGVFGRTDTWKADMQLAMSNAASVRFNKDPIDQARSIGTAIVFGAIGTSKMCIQSIKDFFNKR